MLSPQGAQQVLSRRECSARCAAHRCISEPSSFSRNRKNSRVSLIRRPCRGVESELLHALLHRGLPVPQESVPFEQRVVPLVALDVVALAPGPRLPLAGDQVDLGEIADGSRHGCRADLQLLAQLGRGERALFRGEQGRGDAGRHAGHARLDQLGGEPLHEPGDGRASSSPSVRLSVRRSSMFRPRSPWFRRSRAARASGQSTSDSYASLTSHISERSVVSKHEEGHHHLRAAQVVRPDTRPHRPRPRRGGRRGPRLPRTQRGGKSTTIRVLLGLLRADSGGVQLLGRTRGRTRSNCTGGSPTSPGTSSCGRASPEARPSTCWRSCAAASTGGGATTSSNGSTSTRSRRAAPAPRATGRRSPSSPPSPPTPNCSSSTSPRRASTP